MDYMYNTRQLYTKKTSSFLVRLHSSTIKLVRNHSALCQRPGLCPTQPKVQQPITNALLEHHISLRAINTSNQILVLCHREGEGNGGEGGVCHMSPYTWFIR